MINRIHVIDYHEASNVNSNVNEKPATFQFIRLSPTDIKIVIADSAIANLKIRLQLIFISSRLIACIQLDCPA